MGTRSLTHIKDGEDTLVTIYRQYDGYPDGMGIELADILKGKTIVNGFSSDDQPAFNGMGCLAAQVIKELKDGIGNVYIAVPNANNRWEDYVYEITGEIGQEATIKCFDVDSIDKLKLLFEGHPTEFIAWANQPEPETEEAN